jgi:hypothetical protein
MRPFLQDYGLLAPAGSAGDVALAGAEQVNIAPARPRRMYLEPFWTHFPGKQ